MNNPYNTNDSGNNSQPETDNNEYGRPQHHHHSPAIQDALWNHTGPEYTPGYSSAERVNPSFTFSGSHPHLVPVSAPNFTPTLNFQHHEFSTFIIPSSGPQAPQPLYNSTSEHNGISPPHTFPFLHSPPLATPGGTYAGPSLDNYFSGAVSGTQFPWDGESMNNGDNPDLDLPVEDSTEIESPLTDETNGSVSPKGKTTKPRMKFTPSKKEKVHGVRKAGACVRCQFFRESCDEQTPCGRCKAVEYKRKTWDLPCVRMNLTEAQLFRGGNSKFGQNKVYSISGKVWKKDSVPRLLRLGRIPHLAQLAEKNLNGKKRYPTFTITCREFEPEPGDLLHETWRDPNGKEVKLPLPPIAAIRDNDIDIALKNFVRLSFDFFEYDMVHGPDRDPLVSFVFEQAINLAREQEKKSTSGEQQNGMLMGALHIWVLSRLASEGFTIVGEPGEETFGIERVTDPTSPYNGQIPLPPILDHQLDHIGIVHMFQCKAYVLRELKGKLAKRKEPHRHWLEIFLTMFILLDNLELVWRAQLAYAKRHENTFTGHKSKTGYYYMEWAKGWEHAAHILLTHFHITKMPKPRSSKPKKKQKPNASGSQEPAPEDNAWLNFVVKVNELRRGRDEEFARLANLPKEQRDEDNTKMLWTSRLFEDFPLDVED